MNTGRFRPKKRFGQNFLHDRSVAAKIVAAAGVQPGDVVVELGPGHGVLTRLIAKHDTRLIALEVDRELAAELRQELAGSERNELSRAEIEIVEVDFTTVALGELLRARGLARCVLIGNIPYNLTRNVLFDFLVEERDHVDRAIIMMQREVGDRVSSPPGSRVYGIPSVVLQSLYEIQVVTKVAAGAFHPRPQVASIVLKFTPLASPLLPADEVAPFIALVRKLFQQRRKTVQNSLRFSYQIPDAALARIAADAGVDLQARPEALSKEQFIALSRGVAGAQV